MSDYKRERDCYSKTHSAGVGLFKIYRETTKFTS